MSKRTAPLLYIYQPKETEVEAINQEFVYKKFKVHVDVKPSEKKAAYTLDPNFEEHLTEEMSILEKLEYVFTSLKKDQEIRIEVGNEIHKGYLEEVDATIVMVRVSTQEKPLQLNVNEIKSVQVG
jgi:hypothetical protein